ncbi:MAG: substrate-binding domain-containing protein [Verrucomicrobiota bacterium]
MAKDLNGLHPTTDSSVPPNILLAFDWFDPRIYRGIAHYSVEANWHLSPYFYSERHIPYGWPGDGVITCYGNAISDFVDSLNIPTVDISVIPLKRPVPKVLTDNRRIAELAVAHFEKRGYQHFAFFSWPTIPINAIRLDEFRNAAERAGVPPENFHVIQQAPPEILQDWKAHTGYIRRQLENLPRPLGVFTGQDNLGATLIDVCARSDIHVPDEVAVLGVDNIEFLCDSLAVPLSSVDTRLEELGYQAANQLHKLLKGEITNHEAPLYVSPGQIIRRRSSEALAVSHPKVAEALQIMRANFGNGLTLEQVSEAVKMSKRGLEKAFQKHLSRSPATELRRIRLDHAKRMLAQTDTKIESIALECGYCNSSNLSLAFKKDTQLSPREYRQKFTGQLQEF